MFLFVCFLALLLRFAFDRFHNFFRHASKCLISAIMFAVTCVTFHPVLLPFSPRVRLFE